MEFSFHVYNKLAENGLTTAIDQLLAFDVHRRAGKKHFLGEKLKMTGAGMRSNAETANLSQRFEGDFAPPVIVCIGSDLAIGDSLGPITGSLLKYKTQGVRAFIYGTLALPITAKEIKYLRAFLKETHKNSQIIAIDAAVGAEGDIGLIKAAATPLFPGAGANKKLGAIGDISILGIVAEKSVANYGLLNTTRLNLVYSMAEKISDALATLLYERQENFSTQNA